MHTHGEQLDAETSAAAEATPALAPGTTTIQRVLALQRSVGNAAVAQLLARQPAGLAEAPDPSAPDTTKREPTEAAYTALKYVVFFVGRDLYGTQARRFAKLAMPQHKVVEASTMEDAMVRMRDHARSVTNGGKTAALISEIVIVSHANKSGFIKMPLVAGRKGTTVEELHQLQTDFRGGKHPRFKQARSDVLQLIDERTDVIVRGCRAGRVQALTDALASFFGGQATVYVPTEYQAFTRMKIGGATIEDAIAAYDFLEARGYIPYGLAYTEEEKKRWVAKNLPDGYVPEMFLVEDVDEDAFRHGTADDPALQAKKRYDDASMFGLDKWSVGRSTRQGSDDADLDPMPYGELLSFARDQLAELRRLESEEPDNWRSIGYQAWMVRRAHAAWLRRPESMQIDPGNHDPVAGLTIPGLNYDTNRLAQQAGRRPDLIVPHTDAFEDEVLKPSAVAVSEEVDTLEVTNDPKPKGPQAPLKGGGQGITKPKEVTLEPDTVTPLPGMPEMDPQSLDLTPGEEQEPGPGMSVRVPNVKRKIPIWSAPKDAPADGYFQLKGIELGLEGYVDWGTKGEQEIAIGQLVSLESGKPYGIGVKGDIKFKEWQSGNWKVKWKGGFEVTESGSSGRGKYEASTGLEVSNGQFVGEVKLFASYDEIKGELRIGGIKFSPLGVQGEFKLPLADGTYVTCKGKALLTFDFQPNWAKIAERLGLRVGGTAATAVAGGETIATGFAAIGAAETLALTGAAAGIAITCYAYYRGIKDWQDIKKVLPVAEQASADYRGGYLSVFGVSLPGADKNGAMWAKGVAAGAMMSQKMAQNMLKGYKAKFGYDYKGTVADAEQITRDELAASPQLQSALRDYAYGAFHQWVLAEFYRQWRSMHKGEWTFDKNDKFARTYLGQPDDENPPTQPNWTYRGKPEPQVIDQPF